jgi:hypothetical protein
MDRDVRIHVKRTNHTTRWAFGIVQFNGVSHPFQTYKTHGIGAFGIGTTDRRQRIQATLTFGHGYHGRLGDNHIHVFMVDEQKNHVFHEFKNRAKKSCFS